MTRCFSAFLISVAVALASCSKSETRKTKASFRTESSARILEGKDSWTYVTENSSFHFVELLGDKGDGYQDTLLLEETFHNENTPGIEGMRGDATIKAWTMRTADHRESRWTAREKANEGEIRERFYRLTAWGCCDVPTIYTYYGLLSGKKLYVSNFDLLEIRGKGDGPIAMRFVAFGYDALNHLENDPVLQYGTDKDVFQKFLIHSGKNYYETPEVFAVAGNTTGKSLDLSDSPTDFMIVLRYPGDVELRVPVENDSIRPEKAKVPKGFSIREEK